MHTDMHEKTMNFKGVLIALFSFLVLFSSFSYSAEKGKAGLTVEFQIDGMIFPTISGAVVKNVEENSAAELSGIVKGEKIIKIGDCVIPGCKASLAKKTMGKAPGETVVLVLQKENGEEYTAKLVLQ